MKIVEDKISINELQKMAKQMFGNLVKIVVDVKKEIMAVNGELHSDGEALLLDKGSKQKDLWGANIYPEIKGKERLEFDSMINVRPSSGNLSRGVDDPKIKKKIIEIVSKLVEK